MNRFYALPTSVFLATGAILGFASLSMTWFSYWETGTTPFEGQWGVGPSAYSESPVKEGPQTIAGLALQRSMASLTPTLNMPFWFMIAALVSILALSLARRKALRQTLGAHGIFFLPSSLMILSLLSWVEFVWTTVENTCIDSTCLSGLFGRWTDPLGSGSLNWGLGAGFFVAVTAALVLMLAGSIELGKNRHRLKQDDVNPE